MERIRELCGDICAESGGDEFDDMEEAEEYLELNDLLEV